MKKNKHNLRVQKTWYNKNRTECYIFAPLIVHRGNDDQ